MCQFIQKMCELVEFDKAVTLTGYGKFHYETFAACAICIISVGFQNGLSAYIFPAAQCELNLTSFQLSLLNIGFLVGGVLSSFLWGLLADFRGRKNILIVAHLFNASCTIICMINHSVISTIICRFLNGFFIGAPGSIIFSYLAEFQPPRYRSAVICYSGIFFTLSWLLLPLLAWVILPIPILVDFKPFLILTSWRVFMMILVLPEILVGFWFMRLPESPKFFVAKGDQRKALIVLRKMFARNTGKSGKEFEVKSLQVGKIEARLNNNLQCRGTTLKNLQEMYQQFKSLFKKPLLVRSLLATSIMFFNMFGAFGLGWWLPELFVRFERFSTLHPNQTITVKELAFLTATPSQNCKPSFDASVIQSTVIMGVASLAGNALSGWLATKITLKIIPTTTMLIGGLSACSIYWLSAAWQNLLIASIFQSAMITANMTIGGLVVELFPTTVGAMAICLTMCAGRMGAMASNLIFGLLMDKHCEIPIFVVAGGVLIGAGLCFIIPKKEEEKFNNKIELTLVGHIDAKS